MAYRGGGEPTAKWSFFFSVVQELNFSDRKLGMREGLLNYSFSVAPKPMVCV